MFVTTNAQGVAHLWSAPNFLILTTITPASGTATYASFNKNNTIFGVATSTSMVYYYNCTDYTLISSVNTGIGTGQIILDFSYDGNYILVCGGSSGNVKVITISTGAQFSSVSFSNSQKCVFASNGNFLVSSTNSATLKYFTMAGVLVWDKNYNSCLDINVDNACTTVVASCNNGANKNGYAYDPVGQTQMYSYTSTGILRVAQIAPDSSYIAYSGD